MAPLNGQTPEWFRDVKFGVWAHWRPQCLPEHGDWYARSNSDAKYVMALANHYDNSDNFKSEYQLWNSAVLATGPAAAGHTGRPLKLTF